MKKVLGEKGKGDEGRGLRKRGIKRKEKDQKRMTVEEWEKRMESDLKKACEEVGRG